MSRASSIWDLTRVYRYESSGQTREDLVIEFRDAYGGSVPALAASRLGEELESYLMVIPGTQLADIYGKWGARLHESNVRSFLQARGKVNQGIRDTIMGEPEMFFSYNNGLSATADGVETDHVPRVADRVCAEPADRERWADDSFDPCGPAHLARCFGECSRPDETHCGATQDIRTGGTQDFGIRK